MPMLTTAKDFRAVQKLPFCYLCGQNFTEAHTTNRDHVPPTAVILPADRDPALWLPTHAKCNNDRSGRDQRMGQLVGLLHGLRPAHPRDEQLRVVPELGLLTNVPIESEVHRWLRAMHSALYRAPMQYPFRMILTTPFPAFDQETGKAVPIRNEHAAAVSDIKRNRKAGRLDTVVSRNGKFIYECVWARTGEGFWACAFALNLYDWKELGRTDHAPARGCAGYYFLKDLSLPDGATVGTNLHVPIANLDPLDPYGP